MKMMKHTLLTTIAIIASMACSSSALDVVGNLRVQGPSPWIDVTYYGAIADDGADDTATVQSAINALPATGGVIFFPKGTFIVNGLSCTNTGSVIFRGMGKATILTRNSANYILQCSGIGAKIVVRDFTVDGASLEQAGINIANADNLLMENLHIKNCGVPGYSSGHSQSWDGVYANAVETGTVRNCVIENCERDGFTGKPVHYLTVEGSRFINCGRMGIVNDCNISETDGPRSSKYIGNWTENCGDAGLHAETSPGTSVPVCDIAFIGNTVKDCGNDSWGYPWGITGGVNTRGVISGNTILNCSTSGTANTYRQGILLYTGTSSSVGAGNWTVTNNLIDATGRSGIYVDCANFGQTILTGNIIKSAGASGIYAYQAPNIIIKDNSITNSRNEGIYLYLASGAIISGNSIQNNSQAGSNSYSAIKTALSYQLVVANNNIYGANHKYGFELDNITYNVEFIGNYIGTCATSWYSFANGTSLGTIRGTKKQFYGTAAPAAGAWIVGDKVLNTAPAAGGYEGWVCVTAGTPGTWKGYGSIQP